MKKLIFLTLITLISFVATAKIVELDSLKLDSTTITEVERIIDKYSVKAYNSFVELIHTASPAVKEGFSWVVKLQIAKGIGLVILLPLGVIILTIGFKLDATDRADDMHVPFYIGGMILTIIGIITTYFGILHLIAPEWYAIKEIMYLFN